MASWNERTSRTHSRQEWALVAILAIVLIALAIFIGALPDRAQAQGFPTMSGTSWSATATLVPSAPTLHPFTPSPTPTFAVTLHPLPTPTQAVTPVPEKGCEHSAAGCVVWLPMVNR